jgi:hypothetical protein
MKKFLDIRTTLERIFGVGHKNAPENKSIKPAEQLIPNEPVIVSEAAVMLTIWTIERNRYAAPRALCTDIEVYPSEAVGLCEDISGYVIDTPSGESVVIEAITGSLVGHSLEVVRDGVSEMTKAQLNTQLDTARKEFNRMNKNVMPNDEFWKALKMGGAEIEIAQDYQE